MKIRDAVHWFFMLVVLMAFDGVMLVAGLRDAYVDAGTLYDKNAVLSAFFTVLWAVREERDR